MGMNLLRDGDTFRTFSPTAVTLYHEEPVTSARNLWQLRITSLHEGASVWAGVKETKVTTFED